jgi:hypothetical protein
MKGNPFSKRNKLCYVGLKWLYSTPVCHSYDDSTRALVQGAIEYADIIVGFNLKFDIHWLMNIGVSFDNVKQLWDCQICEFLLESQGNPYNSLNDALTKYNKPCKLDIVKEEYWNKGIDTIDIPYEIISEYLEYDCIGTESVFIEQARQFGVIL